MTRIPAAQGKSLFRYLLTTLLVLLLIVGGFMTGAWQKYETEIQGISTLVLAGITAIYAWLTHTIAKSSSKQAEASIRQAEAAEEQARQADAQVSHAQAVLVETAKARLSSLTPVASVLFVGSPLRGSEEDSIGNIAMELFDRSLLRLAVNLRVQNHGDTPTLVTALPVEHHSEFSALERSPAWSPAAQQRVLLPGATLDLNMTFRGRGALFRSWANLRVRFEVQTTSPLTGAVDTHEWVGLMSEMPVLPGSDNLDHSNASGFRGASAASLKRVWPPGLAGG